MLSVEDTELVWEVQQFCARLLEEDPRTGYARGWTHSDAVHVAGIFNRSKDPYELFRYVDEQTGAVDVGYRTRDGREWFPALRQMRNEKGSGLLETLRGVESEVEWAKRVDSEGLAAMLSVADILGADHPSVRAAREEWDRREGRVAS